MTELKIPYNKLELQAALIGLGSKNEDNLDTLMESSIKAFDEKFEGINTKKVLNQKVADNNGIEIKDLINSPNYEKLINEFRYSVINEIAEILIDKGLTHKEAWALMSIGLGLI